MGEKTKEEKSNSTGRLLIFTVNKDVEKRFIKDLNPQYKWSVKY